MLDIFTLFVWLYIKRCKLQKNGLAIMQGIGPAKSIVAGKSSKINIWWLFNYDR